MVCSAKILLQGHAYSLPRLFLTLTFYPHLQLGPVIFSLLAPRVQQAYSKQRTLKIRPIYILSHDYFLITCIHDSNPAWNSLLHSQIHRLANKVPSFTLTQIRCKLTLRNSCAAQIKVSFLLFFVLIFFPHRSRICYVALN